mmetsp:Transcript_19107/g.49323  ORF Transcript_19107/g.49323 Transcript_19107/m.49323 type:complete len:328 (-) Transcript_19107:2-985(-)
MRLVLVLIVVIATRRGLLLFVRSNLLPHTVLLLRELHLLLLEVRVRVLFLRRLGRWVLADCLVRVLVHLLKVVRADVVLDVLGELRLVAVLVILLEHLHVLLHVAAEDVLLAGLRIELFLLGIVAREALLVVWNVEATVHSALKRTKNAVAGGRADQADVEHAGERARAIVILLDLIHLAIRLRLPLVLLIEPKLLQRSPREQQPSRIACCPVCEPDLDPVVGKLVRVSSADDNVALDLRIDDLADHILVRDAHNEAVLGSLVLVLVLHNQPLARVVVRLALAPPAVLHLELLEVLRRLLHLHHPHPGRASVRASPGQVLATRAASA